MCRDSEALDIEGHNSITDSLGSVDKYAEALFGDDWHAISDDLKLSLLEIIETVSKLHQVAWGEDVISLFKKEDSSMFFFPSFLLVKAIERMWMMRNRERLDDTTGSLSSVALASSDVLNSGKDIIISCQESIEIAIEKFVGELEHSSNDEDSEFFSKWVDCAESSHRDLILRDDFSRNFANCLNYYFSQSQPGKENEKC